MTIQHARLQRPNIILEFWQVKVSILKALYLHVGIKMLDTVPDLSSLLQTLFLSGGSICQNLDEHSSLLPNLSRRLSRLDSKVEILSLSRAWE